MAFTTPGTYGPVALKDTAGKPVTNATVTVPAGYAASQDGLGNLTVTGPPADDVTFTVQVPGQPARSFTVKVPPSVAELESLADVRAWVLANFVAFKVHGDDPTVARLEGAGKQDWIGSVEPDFWQAPDAWDAPTAAPASDTTAPTVPTNLAASPGDTTVALSWTASTDAVGVTGYRVRRGGVLVASPTGTSFTDTGLTNGTAYSYTVSAVDAAGNESAQTAAVSVTPSASATVPGAPTIGTATAGDSLATVTFTAPASNGGSAITGYTVTSSPGGLTASVGGSATEATVTGLTNGTAYTFTVTATNAVGTSAPSAASNSVTPAAPASVPDPVRVGSTAVASSGSVASQALTLNHTPQVGDDVLVHVSAGAATGVTITGFTTLLTLPVGSATAQFVLHRRWQSGDSTTLTVTPSATVIVHATAVTYRNLVTSISTAADLLAVPALSAASSSTVTTRAYGPTAVPALAKTVALVLVGTDGSNGGVTSIADEDTGTVGVEFAEITGNTVRHVAADRVDLSAAARSVTVTWATARNATGALLVLKGRA